MGKIIMITAVLAAECALAATNDQLSAFTFADSEPPGRYSIT